MSSTDVIVVGCGNAALRAAITTCSAEVDILVVEMADKALAVVIQNAPLCPS